MTIERGGDRTVRGQYRKSLTINLLQRKLQRVNVGKALQLLVFYKEKYEDIMQEKPCNMSFTKDMSLNLNVSSQEILSKKKKRIESWSEGVSRLKPKSYYQIQYSLL